MVHERFVEKYYLVYEWRDEFTYLFSLLDFFFFFPKCSLRKGRIIVHKGSFGGELKRGTVVQSPCPCRVSCEIKPDCS